MARIRRAGSIQLADGRECCTGANGTQPAALSDKLPDHCAHSPCLLHVPFASHRLTQADKPELVVRCALCCRCIAWLDAITAGSSADHLEQLQRGSPDAIHCLGLRYFSATILFITGAAIVLLVFLDVVLFWVCGASAVIVGLHSALHDVSQRVSIACHRLPSKPTQQALH